MQATSTLLRSSRTKQGKPVPAVQQLMLFTLPAHEWVIEHWTGSAMIIDVRSHDISHGKLTVDTRNHISSLRTNAKDLLQHLIDLWSIENRWH